MSGEIEQKTVIVYDGDCAFCRGSIDKIRSRDRYERFEYVPRNTPGLEERYPQLTLEDFDSGIRVVEPGGAVHVGADGIHRIASELPYFRRWAWLYHAPVVHGITRRMYAWVAANRMKLSRPCNGACEVDPLTGRPLSAPPEGRPDQHSARFLISLFIALILGLHLLADAAKALSDSSAAMVGDRSWPFLAYGMYRTSHGPGDIRTTRYRFTGITEAGAELEIDARLAGMAAMQGLNTHFLTPMREGDPSAPVRLADRLNLGRDDPFVLFRMESEEFAVTESGVVREPGPSETYRVIR